MKHQSKLLLALLHGVGVGAVAVTGGLISTDATAGISATRHNLGSTGTFTNKTSNTTEICVFCHTPHGADTATGRPPLWNKAVPAANTFTTYASASSPSLDANTGNGATNTGSISLICLSCHDGVQAMDNMINAPGSGNYAAGGAVQGYTWVGNASSGGKIGSSSATVTNIGQDLKNDHPIGIQYCGGFSTSTIQKSTCRDQDFNALTGPTDGATTSATSSWYVEAGANSLNAGGRDRGDIILYTRDFGGAYRPSVECGSCHDPHVESKESAQTAFLRVTQNGSKLCLACHDK